MARKHKFNYPVLLVILVLIGALEVTILWRHSSHNSPVVTAPRSSSAKKSEPSFNKNLYSVNQAASLWVVVNKGRALPSSYTPANLVVPAMPLRLGSTSLEMHLRTDAASALVQMASGADKDRVHFMLASGYRSYSNQAATYSGFVKQSGQAAADIYSARPGHSEHQTGLAADLEPTSRQCEVADCFADLPEGKWLAANSYRYGFIIRYQKTNQQLTGYIYEPWHVRYVGKDLAAQVHQADQTLEQFFGLPAYADYPSQIYQLQ